MKKHLAAILASLASVTVLATGCHQATSQQLADSATKQLGLPVFLWAFGDDQCSSRQLSLLYSEYNSGNGASQAAVARHMNTTYSALIVMETQNLGEIKGELKRLQLWNTHRFVVASKTLADSRTNVTRMMPGTRIDKGNASDVEGKVLTVQPTYAEDKSTKTTYFTYDRGVFNDVLHDDSRLQAAIASGKIHQNTMSVAADDVCGRLVKVSELF